jgi:hypothetical protein
MVQLDLSLANDPIVDSYAEKIAVANAAMLASRDQHRDDILAVAALLVDAKANIDRGKWMSFMEQKLPFGIRKAEMLLKIGDVFGTRAAAERAMLPPYFSTMHELASLESAVLDRAFAGRLIHPDVTKAQIDDINEALTPVVAKQLSPAEQVAAEVPAPQGWVLDIEQRKFQRLVDKVEDAAKLWLTRCPEGDRGTCTSSIPDRPRRHRPARRNTRARG